MDTTKFLEILAYTLPSVITGLVAVYFFNIFIKHEDQRRNFTLRKEKQQLSLPLRLQAYERMTLFLERISFSKLLVRVKPSGSGLAEYQNKFIQHIEQEFEHNLSQQIYLTDTCWNAVVAAKSAQIHIIRAASLDKSIADTEKMCEHLLQQSVSGEMPTQAALAVLKSEVRSIY